jgi:methenyltetrahydromethanopterin cyclohydrolase
MPNVTIPTKLLIIALSGRLPAQLALAGGYAPVVIDCFADEDTQCMAVQVWQVASLRLADVQPAVVALRLAHGLTHVVYGSGFESCPETLAYLEQEWVVLGNTAGVFSLLLDKQAFFRQLELLRIPFPETVFAQPQGGGDWLQKPLRGQGGVGIRRAGGAVAETAPDCYWQRYLKGESLSVSFIAQAEQVVLLGFNRQWSQAMDENQPFMFAGVANCAELAESLQNQLGQWLAQLVAWYGLQGLGSLDFIVKDGCCYVLEINARIPASAQLYAGPVFAGHEQACSGQRLELSWPQPVPSAYEILYAPREMRIADECAWPSWALDRPAGGAFIGKHQPICSIIATGNSPQQAVKQLLERRQFIENILNTGS